VESAPAKTLAAELLGANPASGAAQNSNAIQSALNANAMVSLYTPGVYEIQGDTFTTRPDAMLLLGPNVYFSVNGQITRLNSLGAAVVYAADIDDKWRPRAEDALQRPISMNDIYFEGMPFDLLNIPSPYFDGTDESRSVVHPSTVVIPNKLNGYKYWLALTPYPSSDSARENPCVFCSNDLDSWIVPPGAVNPIVDKPTTGPTDYNADVHLYWHTDGYLYLMYRRRLTSSSTNQLMCMRSNDGKTWSAPAVLLTGSTASQDFGSPSFWFNGTQWVIITHNLDGVGFPVQRWAKAGDLITSWSAVVPTTVTPTHPDSLTWWHSSLHRLEGGRVLAIVQDNNSGGGSLWMWQSDTDGASFSIRRLNRSNRNYRSSLIVEQNKAWAYIGYISNKGAPNWRIALQSLQMNRKETLRTDAIAIAQSQFSVSAQDRPSVVAHADPFTGGAAALTSPWTQVDANTINRDGSGSATNLNTNNCRAWVEVGASDMCVQVRMAALPASGQGWLMFRFVDANNYWRVGMNALTSVLFQNIVSGSVVVNQTISFLPSPATLPQWLRVECDGQNIDVYWRGMLIHSVQSSTHIGGTKAGLQASSALGVLFDDFVAYGLNS
jgi:hypothetical protein